MNVYLHELKAYRRNTLVWILSLCAGTLFLFWMYPAFAQNVAPLVEMLANFPMAVQLAFGLNAEVIGSVTGFYAFVITFLTLCGAVQAATLGISVLTKETTGRTADFLLTKPLSRGRVLTAKLLAVLTCVGVTSAVYIGAAMAAAYAAQSGSFALRPFLLISLSFFFTQVIFLAIGFAIGAAVPRIRSVPPVALSVVFAFFILGMVAAALEREDLYYLSPFKYFNALNILQTSGYQASFVLTGAAVTALCVLAGYGLFIRRDVRAA